MAIFIGRRPETAFTRVPNDWARDPKLSFKAKGLLTYLLSHSDGYRLTVEQVVAEATDGKSAVYSAIKELVEHGYLERVQRRGERGKVGEVDYYVADAPQVTTASGFTASGKPESGDELGEQGVSAGGTASRFSASGLSACGESTTKKTRVLEDQVLEDEKTISLSAREDDTSPPPDLAPEPEREIVDTSLKNQNDNPVHRLLLDAGCPSERLTEAERSITAEFEPRGMGWWRTTAANGDLKVHVAAFLNAGPAAEICPDCNGTGEAGDDWMNPRLCDCVWFTDPPLARKDWVPQLKGLEPCEHGINGGDQKAPNGWRYCSQCRGPGWVEPDVQPRSASPPAGYRPSTAAARARQGLDVADELDRQFGHGKYANTGHKPFRNPPISAYYEDWPTS